jgi:Spy/CpxP family protein refolding chaperone
MSSDPVSDILMATIRCVMAVIVNRSYLKFLAFSGYVLFCAMIFMMQPIGVQARDISNMNASPDEVMSQLKTRLNLTEEQEAKMRPIIEESTQKRHEIVRNGSEDRKAVKSQLQKHSASESLMKAARLFLHRKL